MKNVSFILNGKYVTRKVLFTYKYKKNNYLVFENDGNAEVGKLSWSPLKNATVQYIDSDEPVELAEMILNGVLDSEDSLNGEHYDINVAEDNRIRYIRNGCYPYFSNTYKVINTVVYAIVGMIFANFFSKLFFNNVDDCSRIFRDNTDMIGMILIADRIVSAIFCMVLYRKVTNVTRAYIVGISCASLNAIAVGCCAHNSVRVIALIATAFTFIYYLYFNAKLKTKGDEIEKFKSVVYSKIRKTTAVVMASAIVLTMSVCMLFPVARYNRVSNSDIIDITSEYIEACSHLNDQDWNSVSDEEKTKWIQKIVDFELVSNMGGYSCDIEVRNLNFGSRYSYLAGYYDDKSNVMCLDVNLISQNPYIVLSTVLHEARHCWQGYVRSFWGRDNKNHDLFKQNYKHYISGVGNSYSYYRSQPLEVDARNYSQSEISTYCKFFSQEYSDKDFLKYTDETSQLLNNDEWAYAVVHSLDDNFDDYVSIVFCKKNQRRVHIPDEIDGLKVKKIENGAFGCCDNLKKVYISKNVESIDDGLISDLSCVKIKIDSNNAFYTVNEEGQIESLD